MGIFAFVGIILIVFGMYSLCTSYNPYEDAKTAIATQTGGQDVADAEQTGILEAGRIRSEEKGWIFIIMIIGGIVCLLPFAVSNYDRHTRRRLN